MNSSKKSIIPTVDDFPIPQETPGRRFDFLRGFFSTLKKIGSGNGLRLLVICALVFLVYSPMLPGNFIMDDHRLVKDENALVTGEFGPGNIWFQTDFPLSAVAWWFQWLVWGENPAGYHAVNMLLHAASAVLLWRVLARLKIPGAWLIGAVFAVHPVCVNSVARIAELKNTLSLPFFLLSFWAYLRYDERKSITCVSSCLLGQSRWRGKEPSPAAAPHPLPQAERGHSGNLTPDQSASEPEHGIAAAWYAFSLVVFVLALFSKTSTVMLPVLLLGYAAWKRRRITREDLAATIPFFILSAAFGLMSIWFQKNQALASAGQMLAPVGFVERFAIMGKVVWFYLAKVLLPVNLNFVYARWKYDASAIGSFVPLILLGGCLALGWRFRAGWGKALLFGLGAFVVLLFPALGFFDAQFQVKWQVSDHLQYLPMIAPVALAVAGLASLLNAKIFKGVGVAIVLALAALTYQRAQVFSTEENLFRDTLAKNPAASDAHNDLGVILAKRDDLAGATDQFSAAVQSNPGSANAHLNLGRALALNGDFAGAELHFTTAVQLQPNEPEGHRTYADALSQQGRFSEAAFHLQQALCFNTKPDIQTRLDLAEILFQSGNARPAVYQYHKILAMNPDLSEPLNNLAWLLSTSPDDSVRNGAEAVHLAEHACNLTGFKQMTMVSTLAAAYAEAGRFPEAIGCAELVLKSQPADGDARLEEINRQLLTLYRAGKPYREPIKAESDTQVAGH